MNPTLLGVDIGGSSVKALTWSPAGGVGQRWREPISREAGAAAVIGQILSIVDTSVARSGATAIGVAVPGVVDENAGVAVFSENLGWRDWPVRSGIAERTGLPTAIGHDVRLGAAAESARHPGDLVFVAVGTGVGAAAVLDGRVRATRFSGEIGHLVAERDGPPCACGKSGCVEAIGSAAAIAGQYTKRTGERVDAREVAARLERGDPVAGEVWRRAVDALAHGVTAAIAVLDPDVVVVGGGLAAAGHMLFDPLRAALAPRLAGLGAPQVLPAGLGQWANAVGAAQLALRSSVRDGSGNRDNRRRRTSCADKDV
ncbi:MULTISPECIES: ROK family protein [Amycolatopsis]|uniref:ROK family protein n=1 Tax=Amycolatopsis dongchuanensis TaxID=1070866 RepID=A0ABP9PXX4_9PSEU